MVKSLTFRQSPIRGAQNLARQGAAYGGTSVKPRDMSEAEYNDLILRLLELDEEDWKDFDRRVMASKLLRLHEQVLALQAHHRSEHNGCGKHELVEGNVIDGASAVGKFLAA